jgi:3-phenylpropionate/trans-cinnamate dioxygenase ferredoxin subunit
MSTRAALAAEVAEGELVGVLVDGRHVVVGRAGGRLYAIDGVCTHQYADLEHGTLSGERVICHFHGSTFDIRTGAVVSPPASEPIASFPVSVEGGRILVGGVPAEVRVGYTGLLDNG